ncbi:MAG: outer rane receptor protein [Nevskia sp.]|nr:outer rane receptor protein [Nevskia sp.]
MNKHKRRQITCGLLLSLPLAASFAQDKGGDSLDSILGSDSSSSSASVPVAAAPATPGAAGAPTAEAAPTATPEAPATATAGEPSTAVPVQSADTPAGSGSEPAARSPARNRLVEEIVVTAQKREESIQDVPIAITAFSADKLDALGIQSAQDLDRITPGLTITNAAGFNVAFLRGIGTDAFLPGADTSVPFYVDGVPLLGAQGSSDTLGRVTRVEVLKGPQGTLFGRNATGGAINIITPDPSDELSGDVDVEIGNYAQRKAMLYANVPIAKGLAASISGFASDQRNFYTNTAGPIIPIYSFGGRAKVRWDILDSLRFTVAGAYQAASNNAGLTFENTRVAPILCPLGVCILPQDPKADRVVSLDSEPGAKINSYLFSGTFDWRPGWVDVKLIGSTQRLSAPFVQADFDKSALPIVNITSIRQVSPQVTAELQVLSNDNTLFSSHFKWVAGLFYLKSSGGFDPIAFDLLPNALEALHLPGATFLENTINGLLTPLGLPPLASRVRLLNYGVLDSRSYSAYFQGTYKLLDSLDLTLGGRVQHEDRALVDSKTSLATANGAIPLLTEQPPGVKANQFSPRVALQWHPFDNGTQIYASWSRAYKSPTFNTVNLLGGLINVLHGEPNQIKPLKAERVSTAEVGVKTDLFDGSLRIDAAAFYTRQHDLLTGFVALESGGVVSYENAPAARIRGLELDFVWSPLPELDPGLAITGAGSYLDGRYTDYPNGRGFDTTTGLAFGNDGIEVLPPRDFKGNRIVRTPNFTGNLGVNQSIPVGNGRFEVGADTNYSSGFFFLPQSSSLYARNPYDIVNARLSYFYEPARLELTAFVQNVANISYNEVVFVDDFGRNQVLNAPRTFGGRVKWSF